MPNVFAFECGPVATNCYLVCDPSTKSAFVVDAPYGCTNVVIAEAKRQDCVISDIVLTHTHWDHTADCAPLARLTGAHVFVHVDDQFRLVDPMKHTLWPLPFTIEPVLNAHSLAGESGTIALSGRQAPLHYVHTPGHTEGGICLVERTERRVFVGDTLFCESVGRVDLPGGDGALLVQSIQAILFRLDDDFVVFPGHGPTTTIGHERQHNPFVGEHLQ